MANELPNETARGQEALYAINQVIDTYDRDDLDASLKKCLQVSHEFLSKKAAPDAHHVTAVGNWYDGINWGSAYYASTSFRQRINFSIFISSFYALAISTPPGCGKMIVSLCFCL